jgi:hypothetical protein
MIGLSLAKVPERSFNDLSGTIRSEWGGINAVVPVFRSMTSTDAGISLSQFAITGSVRKNIIDLPLPTSEHDVTTALLGASWMLRTESKQIYSVSGSVGFTEDKLLSASRELRVKLTALGQYRISDPVKLIYGINYSAIYGRDLLLPLVGINWKPMEDWSGTLVLPFSLSVRYTAGSNAVLRFAVSASGERMNIANDGNFAGGPSVLQMRIRGAKISLSFLGKISDDVHVNIEAGGLSQRNLEILASDATLLSARVKATGYVSAGFRFYFSLSDDINELF